jgi:hypothetical protein
MRAAAAAYAACAAPSSTCCAAAQQQYQLAGQLHPTQQQLAYNDKAMTHTFKHRQ